MPRFNFVVIMALVAVWLVPAFSDRISYIHPPKPDQSLALLNQQVLQNENQEVSPDLMNQMAALSQKADEEVKCTDTTRVPT